ncbi:MAG: fructose-1,6-bisphosphatase [Clostridia bacterium]|nr:fructose-1,6-bisphosphatase [Clostridia bacterium]NLS85212.1 fructose-1,6-bisphosphatase [Oscillospiraceae bacterium]
MTESISATELKFLKQLSKEYPTISAASGEIINLQAILKLPKPTEHFMSDLHGESEAFTHILSNASGVIKEKVDRVLSDTMSAEERAEFATLIYYPAQKLAQLKVKEKDLESWYRITLYRMIDVCRMASSKYTRSFVRKRLPHDFAYIIDELLHAHFEDHDKENYYGRILSSIIDIGRAEDFIIAMAELIKRLAVFKLHIVGDIFDRGARPDIIIDELMSHHSVDIQWGNHDVQWMGAAAGSPVCIAGVIHITLSYNNLETLEDGYGINLRPLSLFAEEFYKDTDVSDFMPKNVCEGEYTPRDLMRVARMHKAIAMILFKLEAEVIARNSGFDMEDRALLNSIDFTTQRIKIDGVEYSLKDCDFPTVDPQNPTKLTPEEHEVMIKLCQSFEESERLQRHIRFIYAKGSVYKIENNNLLYHGAIPFNKNGSFSQTTVGDRTYYGRSWMDFCERMARQGYFAPDNSVARRMGQDFLWYLWCGKNSPIFGRDKMSTFEQLFIDDADVKLEKKNSYYDFIESEDTSIAERTALKIFDEFGLDGVHSHIINGHVPVRAADGETPIKAGGRLIVIDGGFCKAYHTKTGIAGYTLVSSSRGLTLRSHGEFESTQQAILDNVDILSTVNVFETNERRIRVEDTDEGMRLQCQIEDLKKLLTAYADGTIKEQA